MDTVAVLQSIFPSSHTFQGPCLAWLAFSFSLSASFRISIHTLRRPGQDTATAKEKAHEIALKYCLQLYRGKPHLESEGCWTKAVVYQRGLHLIERAVAENPAVLEYLALGKMTVEHIPHLQALQVLPSREVQHQKEQEKHDAEASQEAG
jgi:hypothetical protein